MSEKDMWGIRVLVFFTLIALILLHTSGFTKYVGIDSSERKELAIGFILVFVLAVVAETDFPWSNNRYIHGLFWFVTIATVLRGGLAILPQG